jgi:hypothetical protein
VRERRKWRRATADHAEAGEPALPLQDERKVDTDLAAERMPDHMHT